MKTRKFKQVPSINRIGMGNPQIPRPVVVSYGEKNRADYERIISHSMRTDSRAIGVGEPIDWEQVYN